jgi:hypothetical protein
MSDDPNDDFDEFDDEEEGGPAPLEPGESALVRRDLRDLGMFEQTFAAEGFRGVAIFCQDCVEEHFYPWEMMRENLQVLLETGDTPVHEPAFAPDPDEYVPWDYARGYVDALTDAGVFDRRDIEGCPRCGWKAGQHDTQASFCPRCGNPLLRERLLAALLDRGFDPDEAEEIINESGLPG